MVMIMKWHWYSQLLLIEVFDTNGSLSLYEYQIHGHCLLAR